MHLLINTKSFFTNREELRKVILDLSAPKNVQLILAVPASLLYYASTLLKGNPSVLLTAQDISSEEAGAYTGQENGELLKNIGANAVLIGHPETRTRLALLEEDIEAKIERANAAQLLPIVYIGNSFELENATLAETVAHNLKTIVRSRTTKCLLVFESDELLTDQVLHEIITLIELSMKNIQYTLLLAGGVDAQTIISLKNTHGIDGFALAKNALTQEDREKIYHAIDER